MAAKLGETTTDALLLKAVQQVAKLEADLQDLTDLNKSYVEVNLNMTRKITILGKSLKEKDMETVKLKQEIDNLHSELLSAQHKSRIQAQDDEKSIVELKREIDILRNELLNAQYRQGLRSNEREAMEQKHEIVTLRSELLAAHFKNRVLEEDLSIVTDRANMSISANLACEQRLKRAESSFQKLKLENTQLREKLILAEKKQKLLTNEKSAASVNTVPKLSRNYPGDSNSFSGLNAPPYENVRTYNKNVPQCNVTPVNISNNISAHNKNNQPTTIANVSADNKNNQPTTITNVSAPNKNNQPTTIANVSVHKRTDWFTPVDAVVYGSAQKKDNQLTTITNNSDHNKNNPLTTSVNVSAHNSNVAAALSNELDQNQSVGKRKRKQSGKRAEMRKKRAEEYRLKQAAKGGNAFDNNVDSTVRKELENILPSNKEHAAVNTNVTCLENITNDTFQREVDTVLISKNEVTPKEKEIECESFQIIQDKSTKSEIHSTIENKVSKPGIISLTPGEVQDKSLNNEVCTENVIGSGSADQVENVSSRRRRRGGRKQRELRRRQRVEEYQQRQRAALQETCLKNNTDPTTEEVQNHDVTNKEDATANNNVTIGYQKNVKNALQNESMNVNTILMSKSDGTLNENETQHETIPDKSLTSNDFVVPINLLTPEIIFSAFEALEDKPVEKLKDKPVESMGNTGVEILNDKHVEIVEDKTVENIEDKPVENKVRNENEFNTWQNTGYRKQSVNRKLRQLLRSQNYLLRKMDELTSKEGFSTDCEEYKRFQELLIRIQSRVQEIQNPETFPMHTQIRLKQLLQCPDLYTMYLQRRIQLDETTTTADSTIKEKLQDTDAINKQSATSLNVTIVEQKNVSNTSLQNELTETNTVLISDTEATSDGNEVTCKSFEIMPDKSQKSKDFIVSINSLTSEMIFLAYEKIEDNPVENVKDKPAESEEMEYLLPWEKKRLRKVKNDRIYFQNKLNQLASKEDFSTESEEYKKYKGLMMRNEIWAEEIIQRSGFCPVWFERKIQSDEATDSNVPTFSQENINNKSLQTESKVDELTLVYKSEAAPEAEECEISQAKLAENEVVPETIEKKLVTSEIVATASEALQEISSSKDEIKTSKIAQDESINFVPTGAEVIKNTAGENREMPANSKSVESKFQKLLREMKMFNKR